MAGFDFGEGFERFQRSMEQSTGEFTKIREGINEIVGKGEAADGRIRAEYRSEGGLSGFELDPRALRLPSIELSQEIRNAVNAAVQDFHSQVKQLTSSMFSMPDDPRKAMDPSAALAKLDQMSNAFAGQMKDLARELGLQQQRAKEAMDRYRDLRGD